jgi:hypothetical protein
MADWSVACRTKIHVVSKPNEWSTSVAKAAGAIDAGELSETEAMRERYWAELNFKSEEIGGAVSGKRKPQPQSWMHRKIDRSQRIGGAMNIQKSQIRGEIYLRGPAAKTFFRRLKQQENEIESELGYRLDWQELPEGQDCRIAVHTYADPTDEADWPRQHEWLAKRIKKMYRVFAPRVGAALMKEAAATP